ncbi:MAG: hypothetical protein M3177_01735 [Pseudomonadota bacterium]|nr:hypothetical protein [Pseudomonadota bacterium]
MKRAVCTLLAAGAAMATASPAAADNDGDAIARIYDAGRCIVTQDRGTAVSLLRTLPIDGDEADLSNLPERARRCASGLASADPLHLRGAIAQALFFRDFGGFGAEPRRSAPLVNLSLPTQDTPGTTRSVQLYKWADCVVRNDAPRAEALMSSGVGSRAEAAVIERMRDYMAACAPEGAQLAVLPAELRSLVAQSAYHSMYRYWTDQLAPVRDQ